MANTYTQTSFRLGYDGYIYWVPGDGTTASLAPQFSSANISYTDNISAMPTVDASAIAHNSVMGMRGAGLSQSGNISIDRSFQTIINTGFGPRTSGQLVPWVATVKESSAFTAFTLGRIWLSRFGISGSWSASGAGSALSYSLASIITDPDNRYSVASVTTPSIIGVTGTDFSTFNHCSFSNGAASSPTVYDGVRGFSISLDNRLQIVPANDSTYASYRLAAGCIPGLFVGSSVTITQLKGATNVIPLTTNTSGYPLNIIIKSPDASHTLTLAMSLLFINNSEVTSVDGVVMNQATYILFGGQASNSTSTWPIVATYA